MVLDDQLDIESKLQIEIKDFRALIGSSLIFCHPTCPKWFDKRDQLIKNVRQLKQ